MRLRETGKSTTRSVICTSFASLQETMRLTELQVRTVLLGHVAVTVLLAVLGEGLVVLGPRVLGLNAEGPAPPPEVQAQRHELLLQVLGELAVLEVLPLPLDPAVELGHVRVRLVPRGDLDVPVHLVEGLEGLEALVPHDAELDPVRLGHHPEETDLVEALEPLGGELPVLVQVAHPSHPVAQRLFWGGRWGEGDVRERIARDCKRLEGDKHADCT